MASRFRNLLKRFLPPPVKVFMREIKELRTQLEKLQKENTFTQELLSTQNNELKRLHSLFKSVNRENLRIFLESKEERARLQTENLRISLESKEERA
ncbi:MAG TPA: hypothetical protein DCZ10_09070, partial [Pelotomaculum sp.]|nr:hypothetical protein [Pelotomaculum sp.]